MDRHSEVSQCAVALSLPKTETDMMHIFSIVVLAVACIYFILFYFI